MQSVVLVIFIVVYLGMIAGEIPGLALDRTGIALLGALSLIAIGYINPAQAWEAVDVPTIALLFGLMVVSAQFRLGGFYTRFAQRLSALNVSPPALLAFVIVAAGVLSAALCNDIICLAMTPILLEGCAKRELDPVPFLIALACAANVGSAATLIGNPQNMLIGQYLKLGFGSYLLQAIVPVILSLVIVWLVICQQVRGRWHRKFEVPLFEKQPFDFWHTIKGFLVLVPLVLVMLVSPWPRDVIALVAAGIILTSRRMASRSMLQLVDWQLLVLFAGLFIINHAMTSSGNMARCLDFTRSLGIEPSQPAWLFGASVVLSNLVSNVPATMLLLPSAQHPMAGAILALSSTLAGNFIIVGSIANMIVVEQADRLGLRITWRAHARIGVPVTLLTLGLTAAWLYVSGGWHFLW